MGSDLKENTMESFNNAMTFPGLSGIELDVFQTHDGKLAVFHDLTYPVLINNESFKLPVSTLIYDDHLHPEGVPVLQDVLRQLLPSNAGIVVELKYPTNDAIRNKPDLGKYSRTQLVRSVLECLQENSEYIANRWIVLSSFDPDIVWILSRAIGGSPQMVLHNVWFGHESEEDEDSLGYFKDTRNSKPAAALEQANAMNTGIAFEADYVLSTRFDPEFSNSNIRMFSYGSSNLELTNLAEQTLIDAFFIDDMTLPTEF